MTRTKGWMALGTCSFWLWLASASPASASLIIGDITAGSPVSSKNPVGNFLFVGGTGGGSTAAMGFTLGGADYALSSVEVLLTIVPGVAAPQLALYSDKKSGSADVPNALLQTLATTTTTTGTEIAYVYNPVSPITLAANTSYWLVMSSTAGQQTEWDAIFAPPTGKLPTGTGATAIAGSVTGTGGAVPATSSTVVGYYEVDGTPAALPTPEPSGLVMAGAGLIALVGAVWARRRASAA
jgi:hypothetical protein